VHVVECFVPAAGAGEGFGAVGEQGRPEPLGEFAVGGVVVDEVGNVDAASVDLGVGSCLDSLEQVGEELMGTVAVAVAGEEPGEVDQRL